MKATMTAFDQFCSAVIASFTMCVIYVVVRFFWRRFSRLSVDELLAFAHMSRI